MKKLLIVISISIFNSCLENKEPRKPITEDKVKIEFINKEVIDRAVLYEANIRQYSVEGTFNAFANDLGLIKEMGVNIIWLMPINPISSTKSKGPLGSYYAISDYEKINPEFITTGNIGCITQIANGTKIPILHTVEIIDWYTGGPKPKVLKSL